MRLPDPPPAVRRVAVAAAAVALLAAFALQAATALRRQSLTHDEASHFTYGRQVLESRSFLRRVHRHNATSPWMVVPAAAAATAGGEAASGRLTGERLLRARQATVLFGLALGLVVFGWAREAYGPRAALLALALFAFSPHVVAHAGLVTTDVLAALAVAAACWALWRLHRRRTGGRLAAAGVALGLALTTKATAFDLVPVAALLVGWRAMERWRARRRGDPAAPGRGAAGLLRDLALVGLVALVTLNAVHLFEGTFSSLADQPLRSRRARAVAATSVGDLPLPLPAGWVQGVDWLAQDVERGRWTYLLGDFSHDGFPHYYLVALGTKSTLGSLALLLAALALALGRRHAARSSDPPAARYLLVPAAWLFLHLSLFHSFQVGLRHLLPALPLLWIAASPLAVHPRRAVRAVAWTLVAAHAASSLAAPPTTSPTSTSSPVRPRPAGAC